MCITERFGNQVHTGMLCVYFSQHKMKMLKIQGNSLLADIAAGDDFIGLYDQKKVSTIMGPFLSGYKVMGVCLIFVNTVL
jgi:hypothetical protein